MTLPSLCVVIPTIGRSNYLHETVESLLRQTKLPSEIVFVWNGCNLHSCLRNQIIQLTALGVKIKHVHHATIVDIAESWTSGLKESSCNLVFFLGDDDLPDPDFIETAISVFNTYTFIDVYTSSNRLTDDTGTPSGEIYLAANINSNQEDGTVFVDFGSASFLRTPPIMSSVFKKTSLERIGYFIYPGLAFDTWAFRELAAKGYYLYYTLKPKLSYRRSFSAESKNLAKHSLDYISAKNLFVKNHFPRVNHSTFNNYAASFAATAIVKSRFSLLEAIIYIGKITHQGMFSSVIKALAIRLVAKLAKIL